MQTQLTVISLATFNSGIATESTTHNAALFDSFLDLYKSRDYIYAKTLSFASLSQFESIITKNGVLIPFINIKSNLVVNTQSIDCNLKIHHFTSIEKSLEFLDKILSKEDKKTPTDMSLEMLRNDITNFLSKK